MTALPYCFITTHNPSVWTALKETVEEQEDARPGDEVVGKVDEEIVEEQKDDSFT